MSTSFALSVEVVLDEPLVEALYGFEIVHDVEPANPIAVLDDILR
jgi:hypothetical protein